MAFIASTHTLYNTKQSSTWIYNFSREMKFQFKSIFKLKLRFGLG